MREGIYIRMDLACSVHYSEARVCCEYSPPSGQPPVGIFVHSCPDKGSVIRYQSDTFPFYEWLEFDQGFLGCQGFLFGCAVIAFSGFEGSAPVGYDALNMHDGLV